ncbi:uncharacterized protein LOC116419665 [Sarcophilus harrisii]|uniref:uncharacterized protein LOC116419665 n=1 Tax=Sarcophilus harrisii TaxID=9305 RepID=UPI001301BA62|nr:uncharacterized protein LOC116419665 [Sarcophilus harrisii]
MVRVPPTPRPARKPRPETSDRCLLSRPRATCRPKWRQMPPSSLPAREAASLVPRPTGRPRGGTHGRGNQHFGDMGVRAHRNLPLPSTRRGGAGLEGKERAAASSRMEDGGAARGGGCGAVTWWGQRAILS